MWQIGSPPLVESGPMSQRLRLSSNPRTSILHGTWRNISNFPSDFEMIFSFPWRIRMYAINMDPHSPSTSFVSINLPYIRIRNGIETFWTIDVVVAKNMFNHVFLNMFPNVIGIQTSQIYTDSVRGWGRSGYFRWPVFRTGSERRMCRWRCCTMMNDSFLPSLSNSM